MTQKINKKVVAIGIITVVLLFSAAVGIYEFLYYEFNKKFDKTITFIR
jgi:ABC-type transporter Mla subunit MlaD